jgi:apolipoprotein N-acyltransferase
MPALPEGGPATTRALLAVAGGVLLVAGHPPSGVGLAGLVALAPLVALGRDIARPVVGGAAPGLAARVRAAAGWGTLAGLVAFAPLLTWLVPFGYAAYGLLVVVQAAAVGLFVAIIALVGERRWRAVVTVSAWVAVEALRSTWPLGGFPWGSLETTQVDIGLTLGVARTLGAGGLSAVLATTAVALEEAIRAGVRGWGAARTTAVPADAVSDQVRTPVLVLLGTLVLAVVLGGEPPAPTGAVVEIGIAQAGDTRATSAAGVTRLDSDRIVRVAELALQATRPFADDPPDLVIWPENALDIDIRTAPGEPIAEILDMAVALTDPAPILAGEYAQGPRPGTLFNRMTVFTAGSDGAVEGDSYVKRQPVPFGEYVPGRRLLGWFPPLQQIPNDTLPGERAQVLDVAGARIGSVICFENAFAALVRDQVRAGADVLVVSTNNSSFGDTPMSDQHLAHSRLRAVETGRWVVHAGLSGISAFISPTGEVHERTDLFRAASPRMQVPLVEGRTPAVRLGDAVPWLATALTGLGLAGAVLGGRGSRRDDGVPGGTPSS